MNNNITEFLDSVNNGTFEVNGYPMKGVIDQCKEWCWEGWGIPSQSDNITPPMIAAALFNEAKSQDKCVEMGLSVSAYPKQLRSLAYSILKADGHEN